MQYRDAAILIVRVIAYPVLLLLGLLFYVLHWIVWPFLIVGKFVKEVFALPIRFLAQFEVCCDPIYLYLPDKAPGALVFPWVRHSHWDRHGLYPLRCLSGLRDSPGP